MAQDPRWHVSVLYFAGAATAQASEVLAFISAGTITPCKLQAQASRSHVDVLYIGAGTAQARQCAVICKRRHRAGIESVCIYKRKHLHSVQVTGAGIALARGCAVNCGAGTAQARQCAVVCRRRHRAGIESVGNYKRRHLHPVQISGAGIALARVCAVN